MSFPRATARRAIGVGALTTALLIVTAASAWARAGITVVRFHHYRFAVPVTWPVYDLAKHPSTCVRFNRHAIYLGAPSADQRCPAHAVGRTGAILVEPLRAANASSPKTATGSAIPTGGSIESYPLASKGLTVTATWARDRALLSRILGRRLATTAEHGRSGAGASAANSSGSASAATPAARSAAKRGVHAISAEATYQGLGFDACSAPSQGAMSAWSASPYRGVGVYIGGVNAACSQPNLTTAWVGSQVSAGWHLIPTYVGLQGVGSCAGSCATIQPSQAASEGAAAATDAVTQAQALGLPAGNPIYDDMEQYSQSSSNTAAVLAYLSGWTAELHAEGYRSGIYSSASSAITDLVNAYRAGYVEPDNIWVAHWNGEKTTSDSYVPGSDWPAHQRIHQYSGAHDETYGRVTINIDGNYLDGATADTASSIADSTFVAVAGTQDVYRIAGGAPLFVSDWSQLGGQQPVKMVSAQQFAALRPFPSDGTFLTTTGGNSYRIAGGAPIAVGNSALFGDVQPSVTVDRWDLTNISNPLSHLRSTPLDGTVVEGLPSGSYWSFRAGLRVGVPATPVAETVDDQGLTAFALAPKTGGVGSSGLTTDRAALKCNVPQLKRMSLTRARMTLARAGCRLGQVTRPQRWGRHHRLKVFGQSVAPQSRRVAQFKINIRLV